MGQPGDGGIDDYIFGNPAIGFDIRGSGPQSVGSSGRSMRTSDTPRGKRGDRIPLVIGRRMVPPIVLWAGARVELEEEITTGGGKGGGTPEVTGSGVITYREDAVHALCVGPANKIKRIYANDEPQIYYDREFTRDTHPSGSQADAKDTKIFKVYWGECDQPVNSFWASQMDDGGETGILSAWPHVCYCYWKGRNLGAQPVWPRFAYEVEVRWSACLQRSDAWIEESEPGRGDDGMNAAHVLMAIATGSFPHGAGMNPAWLDQERMEALGELLYNEHLPINIVAADGITAAEIIENILHDIGVNLPQLGRQIVPVPMREEDESAIPEFDEDSLEGKLPERDLRQEVERADRISFSYQNNKRRYTDDTLQFRDDGLATSRDTIDQKTISLVAITSARPASLVADRLIRVEATDPKIYEFKVTRGGRILSPGKTFKIDGFGVFRCVERIVTPGVPSVRIRAVEDHYNQNPTGYITEFDDGHTPGEPVEDQFFDFIEVPYAQAGDRIELQVLRWRGDAQMGKTILSLSTTGSTYVNEKKVSDNYAGGVLLESLAADALYVLEDGPTFNPTGIVDNEEIQDLTGQDDLWRTGRQLAYINGEIFFLRGVEVLSASEWRLKGLIRARMDTLPEAHDIGDRVLIMPNSRFIETVSARYIAVGKTIYLKSLPIRRKDVVDAADVDAVSHPITGRALKPLRPVSFYANAELFSRNIYSTGNDLVFSWSYRVRDGGGNAAGEQLAGEAITATPEPDGGGVLILLETDNTVRATIELTKAEIEAQEYTYDNATLVSDFGLEPTALKARLIQRRETTGGTPAVYESDPVEIEITQV